MARPSPLTRNIHWQTTSSTKEAQVWVIFNVFTLALTHHRVGSNQDIYPEAPSNTDAREVRPKKDTLYASVHQYSMEWK